MTTLPASKGNPWRAAVATFAACGLLVACAGTPKVVRDLPELPAEMAADLATARTAPVLMTKSRTLAVVPQPAPGPLPLAPARACTAVFEGYVLYPITVCYPPTASLENLVLTQDLALASPSTGKTTGVLPARYFKLSSGPGVSLALPWFCSVRSGPWFGHVEGAQICNVNPNVRVFTAQLLGAPEPVVVTWTGAITDVPPPLNLLSIPQTGEFCTCCSGFMCPGGNCVPNPNQCGVPPPALR